MTEVKRLTALIVDDERAVASVLERILDMKLIKADIVSTTREGLGKLDTTYYNLVFTDLNQVPDGIQVYEKARQKGSKAFILTGGTDDECLMTRAQQVAGNDLIMKPFEIKDILERIRRYKSEYRQS